jgi:hypothetical protein
MEDNSFKAKRSYVFCEQLLQAGPDRVFPLLCPKREFDWIDTWDCDIIFSKSGFAEQDCVFSTEFPGDVKETWFVDRYEKDKLIQFIKYSESRVTKYTITLTENSGGTTTAKWEQLITSLNNDGNLYIENFSDEEFGKKIKGLEKKLNHYLSTGEMLRV